MASNNKPFIPSRAKDGRPMAYAIVHNDGTSQSVGRAEFLAALDAPHTLHLDSVSGLAVRLPQTTEAQTIADETRQFNEREAKREQRWATRTLELDKPTASGSPVEVASNFDLEATVQDTELMAMLVAALTEAERHLVVAHYIEGISEGEIAAELGVTKQAVNKRKQGILKKLHVHLSSKGFR